jgi:hypothetical protein
LLQIRMLENMSDTIQQKETRRFYTLKEAAFHLRRCEKSVTRLINRGKLRRDKNFWKIMIPCKDVDNYGENHSE